MANAFLEEENHQASEPLGHPGGNSNRAPRGQVILTPMYLSHINVTMPKDGEAIARKFYTGHLGLRELHRPECVDLRDGVWFDAGGLALHLSVEEDCAGANTQRHFGLGCGDVNGLKARLKAAGVEIEDGPQVPWKRFFVRDPFGNRIEIHEPRGLRV